MPDEEQRKWIRTKQRLYKDMFKMEKLNLIKEKEPKVRKPKKVNQISDNKLNQDGA